MGREYFQVIRQCTLQTSRIRLYLSRIHVIAKRLPTLCKHTLHHPGELRNVGLLRLIGGQGNDYSSATTGRTWLSSTNITAGDWNHVTFTYDSVAGEIKLHVNGAAALTGSVSALGGNNRATMGASREGSRYKVGSSFINSNSQQAYTGLIDDVRVYKRALTDDEAAQLAAASPE